MKYNGSDIIYMYFALVVKYHAYALFWDYFYKISCFVLFLNTSFTIVLLRNIDTALKNMFKSIACIQLELIISSQMIKAGRKCVHILDDILTCPISRKHNWKYSIACNANR